MEGKNDLELLLENQALKEKLKLIKDLALNGYDVNNKYGNKVSYKDMLDGIYQVCIHKWDSSFHCQSTELLPEDYFDNI